MPADSGKGIMRRENGKNKQQSGNSIGWGEAADEPAREVAVETTDEHR